MYWTTPSGTRYQTGTPAATRLRQSVELIAMAGTSISVTPSSGNPELSSSWPGRVTPMKWASSKICSVFFQVRIDCRASAPVMKNRSEIGRASCRESGGGGGGGGGGGRGGGRGEGRQSRGV